MTGIDKAIQAAGGQQPLADRLDCTQQFISKMKTRGWAPAPTARRISALFGIALDELIQPATEQ